MTARTEGAPAAAKVAGPPSGTQRPVSVPILMYHQVTPTPTPGFSRYTVTAKDFAAQMRWLAVAGYRPIRIDRLRAEEALPPRAVAITFDDGFEDILEHAVPELRKRGFPATFFVVAGLMGKTAEWLRGEVAAEMRLMDWASARTLSAQGFQIGAHTMSHPRLTELPDEEVRAELDSSRRMLEEGLGGEVVDLAYPFGALDERVRAIADEVGYRSACSTRRGLWSNASDPLAMPRVSVYGHDSLIAFACRVRTAASHRELARAQWRRLRGGTAEGADA